MTEFQITLWAAGVGSVFSVVGTLLVSWLTQRLERRQQVWQTEINRIIDLEERAGQMVELAGSYSTVQTILDGTKEGLTRLHSDAGRFRRHKSIMQAIRDLHNGLSRLIDDKVRGNDPRNSGAEVNGLYDHLLAECDKVTGKRRV